MADPYASTDRAERDYAQTCGKFYTYIHVTTDKAGDPGRIFYVGKGRSNRAWVLSPRNPYWEKIVAKHGCKVVICAYWDTSDEALEHEIFLISCFRELDVDLSNMTNGGEGGFGYTPSAETNLKRSVSVKAALSRPDVRERYLAKMAAINADPDIQARRLVAIRKAHERPEVLKKRLETLAIVHGDPEIQIRRRESMRRTWNDPAAKADRLARIWSEENKARHLASVQNEGWKTKQSAGLKDWYSDPENMKKKATFLRERDGVKIRCVETGSVFCAISEARDWLRENGHPKATTSGICTGMAHKNKYAYRYHWERL
jgi:hypothetical protein